MARTRMTCAHLGISDDLHDHDACRASPVYDELNEAQQAALREVLGRMPYLAGTSVTDRCGSVAQLVNLLDDLVELLRAASTYHSQVTDAHNALSADVAAMRRLIGVPT